MKNIISKSLLFLSIIAISNGFAVDITTDNKEFQPKKMNQERKMDKQKMGSMSLEDKKLHMLKNMEEREEKHQKYMLERKTERKNCITNAKSEDELKNCFPNKPHKNKEMKKQ